MSKARNSFEVLARKADERRQKLQAEGQQLRLLPDEAGIDAAAVASGKGGRPKGARNKGSSELRRWLAAQGYRMPEDQLAQMAGLASDSPAIVQAMEQVELVMAWAFQDAKDKDGNPREATPEHRVQLFTSFMAIMERAAAALLPYGTPKASPDVSLNQNVNVIVPAGPAAAPDPGAQARDVTPARPPRMVPADVAAQMQQNQGLGKADPNNSDDEIRTKSVSDGKEREK